MTAITPRCITTSAPGWGMPILADDLTSQTFEKALRSYQTFDPARGNFTAWLITIARNTVLNHWRAPRLNPPLDALPEPASPAPTPEGLFRRAERGARPLLRALRQPG